MLTVCHGETVMKKILITLLAAAMIIQAAVLTGYGESAASGSDL